jgi:DNA-binding NarL/FixJ family response regulator
VVKSPIRTLVVEDFEPFRAFVTSALAQHQEFEIIGELSDGLEAVAKAAELRPNLVLLDVGLRSLNGIAAARRIRECSPQSKILFVSGDQSPDIVEQALSTGAGGYLVKSDAGRQLLVAVAAVLQDKQYLSSRLSGLRHNHNGRQQTGTYALSKPKQEEIGGRQHEAVFYSNDSQLLDHLSPFIANALNAGNAAVVIATSEHREELARSLKASGVDVAAVLAQGRYIAVDAAELLSTCMVNGTIEPDLFLQGCSQLISQAANAATTDHPRVAVFGEGPDLLWKQGNIKAAIQDEKLGNQLAKIYAVDILCGYSLNSVRGVAAVEVLQEICAEHSALCCR